MLQDINIDWIDEIEYLPDFITIKKSNINGLGAFADKKIKKNIFIGNYMGQISNEFITGPYIFHSHRKNNIISIDASNVNKSNWCRYMNCSINNNTENIKSYFLTNTKDYLKNKKKINLEGYIIFYTTRDIEKGEELMYYYGDAYANMMDIKYKLQIN